MKAITLLLLFFVLIACNKDYDLESVLKEYDNPKSEYAFIFSSTTIDTEIANYHELLKNYKKGDTLYHLISSHINRLNRWNSAYLDSAACMISVGKPDPCPCPPIFECLYHVRIISWWSAQNKELFKCSVNGKAIKIVSDVYMKEYQLRFIKLEQDLNLKPGDDIDMVIPLSYFSNNKLVNDSLVIKGKY